MEIQHSILQQKYSKEDCMNSLLNECKRSSNSLQMGEFINLQNNSGDTALHYASDVNDYEMVNTLLQESDINVNLRNNDDMTPLDIAINMDHLCVVNLFSDSNNRICEDLDEYMCSMCMEIPSAPMNVYQCRRGHNYCENCENRQHVDSCGRCGVKIKGLIRNIEFQNRLSRLFPNRDEHSSSLEVDPFESLFNLG